MKKKRRKQSQIPSDVTFLYVLAGLVFLVGFGLLSWFGYGYFLRATGSFSILDPRPSIGSYEKTCVFARALDGVCVATNELTLPPIVAVMVENHFASWPQAGLAEASVVYEAPVEANITRFFALYPADTFVSRVGPVRSARPYFLDWLSEYGNPLYFHVGGSPDALDMIKTNKVNDFNEFYFGGLYFWRSTNRLAPHNTYTSSELWQKATQTQILSEYGSTAMDSWMFDGREPCATDCVDELTVSFAPPTYQAVWKFSTSTGRYERWQAGDPHKNENGLLIVADTVIVQRVHTTVLDSVGRLGMETTGSGEAIVFRDGYAIEGMWKKESRTSRTRFYDASDQEISLKAGKIWVEVVNEAGDVKYEI